MTIQDLKYINLLDIKEAHLNITSAEMYEEAKRFNQHMYDMRRRRWRFLRDLWGVVLMNIVMFAICMPTAASSYTSLLFKLTGGSGPFGMATGGNMTITYIPAVIYAFVFAYFIVIRKIYDWRLTLALSLIPIPTHYAFIVLAIANTVLVSTMERIDNEIKDEIGYPHFVELTLSYIRDEENAKEGSMSRYDTGETSDDLEGERKENPFDKYRTKWDDGEGMLADNDISGVSHTDADSM